jgi:hypothetical protein
VVVAERLHQRSRFFFDGVVIAGLRTENGGLNGALIADTMETAEHLDQSMLHPVDFRDRKVIRHLLGETLQQVTVASNRLLEGIHHLGADQVLGRNHVVQVEPERLLENMPLWFDRFSLGNRNELIVERRSLRIAVSHYGGGASKRRSFDPAPTLTPRFWSGVSGLDLARFHFSSNASALSPTACGTLR